MKFVMQMLQSSSLIKNSSNKADLHVKFRFFLLNFLIAWVKNEKRPEISCLIFILTNDSNIGQSRSRFRKMKNFNDDSLLHENSISFDIKAFATL